MILVAAALVLAMFAGQPPPDLVPLPTSATLSASSERVVWTLVAGHLLFRSMNAGATWEQRAIPPGTGAGFASMSFIDDEQGWLLVTAPPPTQCNAQQIEIWHTTDAGINWEPVDGAGIADSQCKGQISFNDANHGFVSAWDPNHPPVIYWTSDGGSIWSASQPLPDPPGTTTGPSGFELTPERVEAFGSTLLVPVRASDGTVYVYESDDGGLSWTFAAAAPVSGASIGFVSATHCLQLIAPGQSRETTDAGATWYPSTSDYAQAAPIAPELVFGSPAVGYATVRGTINQTTNGRPALDRSGDHGHLRHRSSLPLTPA
jgi:photosystem II stability/assembly factor-like uncharacterized protein